MADEDPPEQELAEDGELDAENEEFAGEDGEDGEEFAADGDAAAADAGDDDDDEDEDVAVPAAAADDDDEDDDDVEADLDAILKDRIAAGDDEEDDDEEDGPKTPKPAPTPSGEAEPVMARQDHEFSCPNCFLLVNRAAVVDGECPHCGGPVDTK
jgi:hypothetical protein